MFLKNKYFCVVFFILSFLFNNELLFNDDNLFDNYAISLGGTAMLSCNECGMDDGRKVGNLNRLNMSLLIKANHRIDLYYYLKEGDYGGFNLPDSQESNYYQLGTQHFIKNKTRLNLNFDFFTNFMFADKNSYKKHSVGCGVSKILDSKDFKSYIRIDFNLYTYKSNDPDLGEATAWSLGVDYPIYMRVLPKDNVPSKVSYLLTPRLILDTPNMNASKYKDMYFNCSFDISYAF